MSTEEVDQEEYVDLDPDEVEEEKVPFSVQGSAFLLKKKILLSQDWLLSKVLTSKGPSTWFLSG